MLFVKCGKTCTTLVFKMPRIALTCLNIEGAFPRVEVELLESICPGERKDLADITSTKKEQYQHKEKPFIYLCVLSLFNVQTK